MDTKQKLELTIRTASVLKAVSQLVGVEDATVAKLMFYECSSQFIELKKFVDNVQPASSAQRRGPSP